MAIKQKVWRVTGYRCVRCQRGPVIETIEKDYPSRFFNTEIILPLAEVGKCDACGEVNYALRIDSENPAI